MPIKKNYPHSGNIMLYPKKEKNLIFSLNNFAHFFKKFVQKCKVCYNKMHAKDS